MTIKLICLDADDTLWQNMTIFRDVSGQFGELLSDFVDQARAVEQLDVTEHRNIPIYGYGAKGFALSMIETALQIARSKLPAEVVAQIILLGKSMLDHPVEMLEGVEATLDALSQRAPLVLVTKGDLYHQEAKLAASGLGEMFTGVEIVSDKKPDTYRRVFTRYGVEAGEAVMAGDSMRSDILPALEAGAHAAFIPPKICWSHEVADAPEEHPRYRVLAALSELPAWIDELNCAELAGGS